MEPSKATKRISMLWLSEYTRNSNGGWDKKKKCYSYLSLWQIIEIKFTLLNSNFSFQSCLPFFSAPFSALLSHFTPLFANIRNTIPPFIFVISAAHFNKEKTKVSFSPNAEGASVGDAQCCGGDDSDNDARTLYKISNFILGEYIYIYS